METVSRTLLTFLLNALWQVPVAWAVAALACRLMPNGPARLRHAVWVAALGCAFLLPVLSVRTPARTTLALPAATTPPIATAFAPSAFATAAPAPAHAAAPSISFPHDWAMLLLGAYGLFLALRALLFLRGLYRAFEIRRDAAPGGLHALLARCETAFSTRGVRLLRSADVSGPVALHRAIVLPEGMFEEFREDVLATAVGHEMAHIARRDFAFKLVYELLYLPLCFHPAAMWIRRGIERSREMACDELVTRHLLEPAVYARSIIALAGAALPVPQPGYVLGVFDGDILEERIRSLIERRGGDLRRARVALAGALATFVICAVFAGGMAVSGFAQSAAQSEMQAAAEAFSRGDVASGVEHFHKAVTLEPDNLKARLFLASAYVRQALAQHQYMPVNEDKPLLVMAQAQYQEVLKRDPKNASATFGMIALNGPSKAGESRETVLKLIASDPGNSEAYYTLGTVDWQIAYDASHSALEALGASPATQQIPDAEMRAHLRTKLTTYIDEGLRALQVALAKQPDSSDTMAYINLLLRQKGLLADTAQETKAYVAEADGWVGKALDAKRIQASKPKVNKGAIDLSGEPPLIVPAPPPPPPGTAPKPRNPAEGGR
uniref:Peptidase M56, BlaR1 n=1 Tax=Solibacter usitatus (strain Ellin6076) TaxID=234267 RepID=Q02CV4_SOLUE